MPEKAEQEEYEVIPMSPLRKMEKRLEELESSRERFSGEEFIKEVVDIIKMNQRLVEDMARANDALKLEISKLPAKMDALITGMGELVSYIKAATVEEATAPAGISEQLVSRLAELSEGNKKIVELTQTMVSALEEIDRKVKRAQPMPPLVRRPPFQPQPMQPR